MKTFLLVIIAITQLFYGYAAETASERTFENPIVQTQIDTPNSQILGKIGLKGQLQDGVVSLKWATIGQGNIVGFKIQRYTEEGYWQSIGFVEADKNSTSEISAYSYVDTSPLPGTSLYRLLSKDIDGNLQFSNTVTIHIESTNETEIQLFPNPSSGEFTLEVNGLQGQKMIVYIFDPNGKLTWKHTNQSVYNWQKQLFFSLKGYYSVYIQVGNAMYNKKLLIK